MIFELVYELLPYAAALYVVDSAVRVRAGETLIASAWGGRFRRAGPGWRLAGLWPTAEVFVVGGPAATTDAASSLPAIRLVRAGQSAATRPLAALGAVLLAIVFGVLPVIVYLGPPDPGAVATAVLAAAATWAAIVGVAVRALRRSGLRGTATLSAIAPALFFPPAAAHALSFLRRDAFRPFPPLAVAAVLLSAADFRRLVRRELRGLDDEALAGPPVDLPAVPQDGPHAGPQAARAALLELVAAAGIDLDDGLIGDASQSGDAAFVCPLCESGYRAGFTTCADCDVALVRFAPPAR